MKTTTATLKPKRRIIYITLGLLFGFLGFHNFYGRRVAEGAFQLMILCVLFWTIVVPVIIYSWSIYEVITVRKDGFEVPMR